MGVLRVIRLLIRGEIDCISTQCVQSAGQGVLGASGGWLLLLLLLLVVVEVIRGKQVALTDVVAGGLRAVPTAHCIRGVFRSWCNTDHVIGTLVDPWSRTEGGASHSFVGVVSRSAERVVSG